MPCTVEQRNRVRRLAQEVEELPSVTFTSVIAPDPDRSAGQWMLELTLTSSRVEGDILVAIAEHELGIVDVTPQGSFLRVEVR